MYNLKQTIVSFLYNKTYCIIYLISFLSWFYIKAHVSDNLANYQCIVLKIYIAYYLTQSSHITWGLNLAGIIFLSLKIIPELARPELVQPLHCSYVPRHLLAFYSAILVCGLDSFVTR